MRQIGTHRETTPDSTLFLQKSYGRWLTTGHRRQGGCRSPVPTWHVQWLLWHDSTWPPWNYPGGVVPLQIVEGHYLFSTKWVGLDDGISTKWSAQRKQYKMTGHIHKQVILDEERNSMLYRSCSGGTCPCIKTKTHFVDMLRVTTNWVARFSVISKISGKGLYKMTPDFLT